MEITYHQEGDYQIPDLALPEDANVTFGHYGRLREKYLKEHHHGIYSEMILLGKLNRHLKETDDAANDMLETLTAQMAETQGVTEKLKAEDQMTWIGMMNNIRNAAEEIVLKEIVYN